MIKDFEFYHNDDGAVITKYRGNSEFVRIPAYVNGKKVIKIDNYCFENQNIKVAIIPNGIIAIGVFAFYKCNALEYIIIPNSVISIDNYTFYGCANLTSVTIPDSVTSVGFRAFAYCNNLASVTIGNGVISIDNGTFCGCRSLTDIYILNKDCSIAASDTIPTESIIHGYAGSTAETFAKENGNKFEEFRE